MTLTGFGSIPHPHAAGWECKGGERLDANFVIDFLRTHIPEGAQAGDHPHDV